MTTDAAIRVDGVSKRFARKGPRPTTLKQLVAHPLANVHRDTFWALQEVNLVVRTGETVGIIGANGSGKSTLLRLIGGLGKPTRGRIVRNRRVDAMLSLGDSLDPLLTGRENAITAGILAGYRRREAVAKLDEIVAFSELDEVIDRPLRTYSDGMKLRLAFAVAISANPEVLLIDEVLSVGDLRFQAKCSARLEELRAAGTTILFASHDEMQVRDLCEQVVWLSRGSVQALGSADSVFAAYKGAMQAETERRSCALGVNGSGFTSADEKPAERFGTREVQIVGVRIAPSMIRVGSPNAQTPIRVEVDLEAPLGVEEPIVGVSLHRASDFVKVLDVSTEGDGVSLGRLQGRRTVALSFDHLDAEPGSYRFDVGVYERHWSYVYDYHWHGYPLEIVATGGAGFGPRRQWHSL
jgi:homopolymeric O-antigen transport system ATP-binding protein